MRAGDTGNSRHTVNNTIIGWGGRWRGCDRSGVGADLGRGDCLIKLVDRVDNAKCGCGIDGDVVIGDEIAIGGNGAQLIILMGAAIIALVGSDIEDRMVDKSVAIAVPLVRLYGIGRVMSRAEPPGPLAIVRA